MQIAETTATEVSGLKAYGEEEQMLDNEVVPKDTRLDRTRAWENTFLGQDRRARTDPQAGGER